MAASFGIGPASSLGPAHGPDLGLFAPEELLVPTEAEAAGQLCSVQLPAEAGGPTASAWCSVGNLVAVALTPEPGSGVARVLVLEPSDPEDCATLEVPVAGEDAGRRVAPQHTGAA